MTPFGSVRAGGWEIALAPVIPHESVIILACFPAAPGVLGEMITADHHAPVESEAGEDRQRRVVVEAVGIVEIRDMLAHLAEGGNLKVAVDAEGLTNRDRDVGLIQGEPGGRCRWLNGWHYSLLS